MVPSPAPHRPEKPRREGTEINIENETPAFPQRAIFAFSKLLCFSKQLFSRPSRPRPRLCIGTIRQFPNKRGEKRNRQIDARPRDKSGAMQKRGCESVISPNIRPLPIPAWGWKPSRNKHTRTPKGHFLVSPQRLKIGVGTAESASCLTVTVPAPALALLSRDVFGWRARDTRLYLKLSGFLTVVRGKGDKRGAQPKKGHLTHRVSESLNSYLPVPRPQ